MDWNEQGKWRKFIHPVIAGLVAMLTAVVGYLQYLQKQDSEHLGHSDKFDVFHPCATATPPERGTHRAIATDS